MKTFSQTLFRDLLTFTGSNGETFLQDLTNQKITRKHFLGHNKWTQQMVSEQEVQLFNHTLMLPKG